MQQRLLVFVAMLVVAAASTLGGLATGTTTVAEARSTYDLPAAARAYVPSPTVVSTLHQLPQPEGCPASPPTSDRCASTTTSGSVVATKAASSGHPTFQPGPYAGESIPARSSSQTFNAAERVEINRIGADTGCHTCGVTTPGTKSGNFVPDHQPVSALNTAGSPQRLFPQCISCSRDQGLAVARQIRGAQ